MPKLYTPLFTLLALGLTACDDGDDGGQSPDAGVPPQLVRLEVEPPTLNLFLGEEIQLKAIATFDDGQRRDVTREALWSLEVEGVLELLAEGKVRALSDGVTRVGAEIQGASGGGFGVASIQTTRLQATALTISPDPIHLNLDEAVELRALVTYNDGHAEDVTEQVAWISGDPSVMRFSAEAPNELTALANGFVEITAIYEDLSATAEAVVACFYPSYPDNVLFNKTMPPLSWEKAFRDGHKEFELRLEDIYCDHTQYGDVSIIAFVVGAGWCSACTYYTTEVLEPEREALEAAGVLFIFLEAQDYDYMPTDSEFADNHLTRLVDGNFGIRVGGLDTRPIPDYLTEETNGYVQAFPTVFVVRRRDMKIIADGTRSNSYLPLMEIARNPNQDWSDPDSRFVNHCGGADEEIYEPNNNPVDAPTISEGAFHGGICDAQADYYRVDIAGPWRLELTFSHDTGNLDVWIWDEAENAPLMIDGEPIGAYSDDDNEVLEHAGPALIRVEGVQGDSAPYDLNITAR
ncbi:Ig-like domain-containing protein [Myxococcota bacterium]|nr:Ig-like domain-containing protein [Myxococcota bacterium]MBU1896645.1 Ig-like domain-containing protein [Myxococcota bacterium]